MYNWQHPDWPEFTYSQQGLTTVSIAFALELGTLSGLMQNLDHELMQQAELEILISEAMKNSEIEG